MALKTQRILTSDEFVEQLKLAKAECAQAVADKKEQAQEWRAKAKWREEAHLWKKKVIIDHKIKKSAILAE